MTGIPFVTQVQVVKYLARTLRRLAEHFHNLRAPDTEYLFSERYQGYQGYLPDTEYLLVNGVISGLSNLDRICALCN